ncbi:UDP-glucosyl transferase 73C2 [Hibiscus trionum]|uniref:UDP-glucosyl transferase 73C2 n=1 Tax=Hibiscus trionum TaxID=183268 RepID=A0A9W7M226_HIBTR|nr:UDP-glucosyl transferase 73C2 [Hibiscus trionum]
MALSSSSQPHFVLIPFMCQGHLLPMIDIAKILAGHGVTVTVITTPKNAARFSTSIDSGGLSIRVEQVQFPAAEVGLV